MRATRGFTLVELLVAVGITAVLAAVLLGLLSRTVTLWERSASALVLENDAGVVLARLAGDLETAYRSNTPVAAEWIEYSENGDTLNELRLISMGAPTGEGEDDPNTLREVSYRMVAGTAGGELYRLEGTAEATLASDYAWLSWPDGPAAEFLLGSGIDQLEIVFHDGNRQPLLTVDADNWPVLARIELTLLTPDGAARLQAVEDGRSNEPAEDIRAETGRTFVRWVAMGGVF